MRRTYRLVFALGALLAATACGSSSSNPAAPTPTAKVVGVVVSTAQTSSTSIRLTATANFSDGSSKDVTSAATWVSSNPALATVAAGTVTVVGSGELNVSATYQAITGTLDLLVTRLPVTSITVTGSPSADSNVFQLAATARLGDGSTQDVTKSSTWTSSNTQIATVSTTGLVTIVASGAVDLQATYQGVSGSTHVTVAVPNAYTLTGVVSEAAPNARPVSGARVQIVGGNFGMTDSNGVYSIAGVPSGKSIIEVTKDGYQTYDNEVTVTQNTQLAITIYPTPPTDSSGASATARCNDGSWSWAQTRAAACTSNGGIAYTVCPGTLCSS